MKLNIEMIIPERVMILRGTLEKEMEAFNANNTNL